MRIKQWSVYLVNLHPRAGTKPGKIRPCLCIQPDYSQGTFSSVILPLSSQLASNIDDYYPFKVRVNAGVAGLLSDSDVLVDQIMAWDNKKFISDLGELPEAYIEDVKKALKDFLDL